MGKGSTGREGLLSRYVAASYSAYTYHEPIADAEDPVCALLDRAPEDSWSNRSRATGTMS